MGETTSVSEQRERNRQQREALIRYLLTTAANIKSASISVVGLAAQVIERLASMGKRTDSSGK